jgi:hypothetical protein
VADRPRQETVIKDAQASISPRHMLGICVAPDPNGPGELDFFSVSPTAPPRPAPAVQQECATGAV